MGDATEEMITGGGGLLPDDAEAQDPVADFLEGMVEHSVNFDVMAQARWDMGAEQYGPFKYLENDVIEMMKEELIDQANYARMQFIKLCILQEMLEDGVLAEMPEMKQGDGSFKMGPQGFKPAGGQ